MYNMTIADLEEAIAQARAFGATDDTAVHVSYDYGDHWHTTVAPAASEASMTPVVRSDYHRMDKVVDEEEACSSDNENSREVFVIS